MNYEKQSSDFLKETKTTLKIEFEKFGSMHWDKEGDKRNVYKCTLSNKNGSYSFPFGDSIQNTKTGRKPTNYDILVCLDVNFFDSFHEFCMEFGHDPEDINSASIYEKIRKQDYMLRKLFDEKQLEKLSEIY